MFIAFFKRARVFIKDGKQTGEYCSTRLNLNSNDDQEIRSLELPVYARIDGKYNGNKRLVLLLSTAIENDTDPLWKNVQFPEAQVCGSQLLKS